MSKTVMKAVIDALKADSSLVTLLGSANNITMAHISQTGVFPGVTVMQNTESSKKRVGYNAVHTRDQYPVIQIDCWTKKSMQEAYQIADLVDIVCVSDGIGNTTLGWQKVSDSDQFEEDVHVYHKALRYSFQYAITDS